MKEKNEEYEALKKKALEQFKRGEPLLGKDGAFAPLLKEFLESALDAEVEEHLDEGERNRGNRRNGKSKKIVKSSDGSFELETPRDRDSTFEPDIVKKRETILADNLESKIIGLYGLGMSLRDISDVAIDINTVVDESVVTFDSGLKKFVARPIGGGGAVIRPPPSARGCSRRRAPT